MTVEIAVQSPHRYEAELIAAISAARAAGDAIRDLYDRSAAETYIKGDGSPVTDADLASDKIIREALGNAFPADSILTEEGVDDETRLSASRVWIVDPIDGTQQFVERTGEFDVLIALVVDGSPVVAVLLQPTTSLYLCAVAGHGAWIGSGDERRALRFDPLADDHAPRLMSSTWLNLPQAVPGLERTADRLGAAPAFISRLGIVVRHFVPPTNQYDALIGLPTQPEQTMAWEWDYVAADLVVHEAGGRFTDVWGRRFRYNKPTPRNIGGVVLSVDPSTHERVLEALNPELPSN